MYLVMRRLKRQRVDVKFAQAIGKDALAANELVRSMRADGRTGKPTQFSEMLEGELFERMRDGETVTSIASDPHMPSTSTIWLWKQGKNGAESSWHEAFARARNDQADAFAQDVINLADSVSELAQDSAQLALENLPEDATEQDKRRTEFFARKRAGEDIKIMIDARKWTAARMAPARGGDKVTVQHAIAEPISDTKRLIQGASTEQLERMAELEEQLTMDVEYEVVEE